MTANSSAAETPWRPAVVSIGRDEIGDVADDEDLARADVENLGGIDPAVGTGDDHDLGALALGQLAPALALGDIFPCAEAPVAVQEIRKIGHVKNAPGG